MLRQQTATRGNDFTRWTVDERLIDRFLRQAALLCAPFCSAYIRGIETPVARIELKFKQKKKCRPRSKWNGTRLNVILEISKFPILVLVFTKSGSGCSLARQVAYRWSV